MPVCKNVLSVTVLLKYSLLQKKPLPQSFCNWRAEPCKYTCQSICTLADLSAVYSSEFLQEKEELEPDLMGKWMSKGQQKH